MCSRDVMVPWLVPTSIASSLWVNPVAVRQAQSPGSGTPRPWRLRPCFLIAEISLLRSEARLWSDIAILSVRFRVCHDPSLLTRCQTPPGAQDTSSHLGAWRSSWRLLSCRRGDLVLLPRRHE